MSRLADPGVKFLACECEGASILVRNLRHSGFTVGRGRSRMGPIQGEKCRSGEAYGGPEGSPCPNTVAWKTGGTSGELASADGDIMTVGETVLVRRNVGFGG